jgi:RNase P subunit RPR2
MVCAKLHIICGNCGAYLSSEDEYNATCEFQDIKDEPYDIYITCKNCGTLHALTDYFEVEKVFRKEE